MISCSSQMYYLSVCIMHTFWMLRVNYLHVNSYHQPILDVTEIHLYIVLLFGIEGYLRDKELFVSFEREQLIVKIHIPGNLCGSAIKSQPMEINNFVNFAIGMDANV